MEGIHRPRRVQERIPRGQGFREISRVGREVPPRRDAAGRVPGQVMDPQREPGSGETTMPAAIQRPKEEYHRWTTEKMEKHLLSPTWDARQKVALTCRMLAAEGHESALAGQITARGEKPGTYHMLTFGLGFDEACASNIILVDDDLNLLEGEGMPNPSNRFHLWIYRHRPDVHCIVHTHPPYVSALSTLGEALAVAHMDHTMFYDDCASLPEWPGVPIGDEEGELINTALGTKRSILLANHGQL